jgi:hypothetical protein
MWAKYGIFFIVKLGSIYTVVFKTVWNTGKKKGKLGTFPWSICFHVQAERREI